MKRRIALAAVLSGIALFPAACDRGDPNANIPRLQRGTPVSGTTDTRCGMTFDFPEGWAEYPTAGRPYTAYFENKERRLALGLTNFSNAQSADTLGDQIKRRLATEGNISESGPLTIDGAPAYRVVAKLQTDTGHGIVIGTAIAGRNDRGMAVYLYSSGDEKSDNRAEMDQLLATLKLK